MHSTIDNKSIHLGGRVSLILLASISLNVLLALGLLWLTANNSILAQKRRTLVQLRGGEVAIAAEHDARHRDPEVLLRTATKWVEMTYAKSPLLPGGERDAGVKIDSKDTRVPSQTHLASFLLPPSYREDFLAGYAEHFIPANFFKTGNTFSIVRILKAYVLPGGNPDTGWTVELVSTVTEFQGDREVSEVNVNLAIKLVPTVPSIDPFQEDDPVELRRAVTKLRQPGIGIASIEPLHL